MSIVGVENVRPVTGRIHPSVHDRLGRAVAFGNVLPGTSIGNAEVFDHLEGRSIDGAVVGKVTVVFHILRLIPGDTGQLPVISKGFQTVLYPDLIDKTDDFLLKIRDVGIRIGNVDQLPRIDQIKVVDLRIGELDLTQSHLIFGGDLPHTLSRYHSMRCGRYCDRQKGDDQNGAYAN